MMPGTPFTPPPATTSHRQLRPVPSETTVAGSSSTGAVQDEEMANPETHSKSKRGGRSKKVILLMACDLSYDPHVLQSIAADSTVIFDEPSTVPAADKGKAPAATPEHPPLRSNTIIRLGGVPFIAGCDYMANQNCFVQSELALADSICNLQDSFEDSDVALSTLLDQFSLKLSSLKSLLPPANLLQLVTTLQAEKDSLSASYQSLCSHFNQSVSFVNELCAHLDTMHAQVAELSISASRNNSGNSSRRPYNNRPYQQQAQANNGHIDPAPLCREVRVRRPKRTETNTTR
ncbi:hypothetical protein BKA70DRAFT_1435992 [Coprinopsis sp. MPI-PUGE-AT-0042]|nr:hypothetical protein BKA70DRAFT_1435992 [Coprinopsis sp. MPI-PUGE-AT-0042]